MSNKEISEREVEVSLCLQVLDMDQHRRFRLHS